MNFDQASLESIHRYSSRNRPLLEKSASAGCFYCGETFAPAEVQEWIEELSFGTGKGKGETARCPRCGIDSVLPSAAPVTLDAHLLEAMRAYWFNGSH